MRLVRAGVIAVLLGALALVAPAFHAGAQTAKKFEKPVLVTSAGQALDAFTVKTLLGRAGVDNSYDPKATAKALDGVRTVVIAVGVSNKGFGQAGITADTEIARTKAILQTAKAREIRVIFVHIGGSERRKGLSVQFIELVAPAADQLIVTKDGNVDDYFDRVSKSSNAPLLLVEQSLDVGKALAGLMATP